MRKLNGKVYLDKSDISELKKESVYFVYHPNDKHEVLYLLDTEASAVVINGISALKTLYHGNFHQNLL